MDTLTAHPLTLSTAPSGAVDDAGTPRYGTFQGRMARLSLRGLDGPFARGLVWKRLHGKRWHYASIFNDEVVFALAIFQAGYASHVFAYLFDRVARTMLFERTAVVPPGRRVRIDDVASSGPRASFRYIGRQVALIARDPGDKGTRVHVSWRGLEVQAMLSDAVAPVLSSVCPVEGGLVHVTQKANVLQSSGLARIGRRTIALDGFGGLDYSNGYLARETSWRWAWAAGLSRDNRRVGFNLSEGFLGAAENVLWVDGRLVRCGPARFAMSRGNTLLPWRLETSDGAVDVELRPEGERVGNLDYRVVKSRYVQPIGTLHGVLRLPDGTRIDVDGVPAVTEDHDAKW